MLNNEKLVNELERYRKSVVEMKPDTAVCTYDSRPFDVCTLEQAHDIILTDEAGQTSGERWLKETPYLTEMIRERFELDEHKVVLDYGCGIGRIGGELIIWDNCCVVGVDLYTNMQAFAINCVDSPRFMACSPQMVGIMGNRFDYAVSIWTLQHCIYPRTDINIIRMGLRPGGRLFVVNEIGRRVPTVEQGWTDDKVDVKAILDGTFNLLEEGQLDPNVVPRELSERTYWALYEQKQNSQLTY
jgi:SAM-dependent methyltransferase